jgi:hypothetical protein
MELWQVVSQKGIMHAPFVARELLLVILMFYPNMCIVINIDDGYFQIIFFMRI